jgi:hypothetical protein
MGLKYVQFPAKSDSLELMAGIAEGSLGRGRVGQIGSTKILRWFCICHRNLATCYHQDTQSRNLLGHQLRFGHSHDERPLSGHNDRSRKKSGLESPGHSLKPLVQD